MINKNLLRMAEQLGRDTLVEAVTPAAPVIGTRAIGEPFILKYDEFGKELVAKVNERFEGTDASISIDEGINLREGEEITNFCDLHRFAMITAIYQDEHLKSMGRWPATPLECEEAIRDRKIPHEGKFHETLAFVYESLNDNRLGQNLLEAEAMKKELEIFSYDLVLLAEDFKKPLLIINAGLEKSDKSGYKVSPIILPGLTEVYKPDVLNYHGTHSFEYGLDNGVPKVEDMGKGNRLLELFKEWGLHVLYRNKMGKLSQQNYLFATNRPESKITFIQRDHNDK
jgi:hypothetical protein